MFFRPMTAAEEKSSTTAIKVTYAFYLIALMGHALYFLFFFSEFTASFWLLMSGFLVNSISEFIFRKRAEGAADE